ncbi:hypothetical protein V2P32_00855 [Mycoplasma sp. 06067-C1-B144P-99-0482-3]|uniref:hypothetical protein n=1 Tax=Mycoplasma sp. 06067-C1-B144P-99-0482-3 TaxID=3117438 RepID=UPI003DA2B424
MLLLTKFFNLLFFIIPFSTNQTFNYQFVNNQQVNIKSNVKNQLVTKEPQLTYFEFNKQSPIELNSFNQDPYDIQLKNNDKQSKFGIITKTAILSLNSYLEKSIKIPKDTSYIKLSETDFAFTSKWISYNKKTDLSVGLYLLRYPNLTKSIEYQLTYITNNRKLFNSSFINLDFISNQNYKNSNTIRDFKQTYQFKHLKEYTDSKNINIIADYDYTKIVDYWNLYSKSQFKPSKSYIDLNQFTFNLTTYLTSNKSHLKKLIDKDIKTKLKTKISINFDNTKDYQIEILDNSSLSYKLNDNSFNKLKFSTKSGFTGQLIIKSHPNSNILIGSTKFDIKILSNSISTNLSKWLIGLTITSLVLLILISFIIFSKNKILRKTFKQQKGFNYEYKNK